jgi:hypothetical protein
MAWVSPDRWLLVKLVPAVPGGANTPPSAGAAQLLLLANGELRDRSGKRLPESFNPIGKWARLLGLDQLGGDRNAPGSVLVNQAVWEKGRLAIQWE